MGLRSIRIKIPKVIRIYLLSFYTLFTILIHLFIPIKSISQISSYVGDYTVTYRLYLWRGFITTDYESSFGTTVTRLNFITNLLIFLPIMIVLYRCGVALLAELPDRDYMKNQATLYIGNVALVFLEISIMHLYLNYFNDDIIISSDNNFLPLYLVLAMTGFILAMELLMEPETEAIIICSFCQKEMIDFECRECFTKCSICGSGFTNDSWTICPSKCKAVIHTDHLGLDCSCSNCNQQLVSEEMIDVNILERMIMKNLNESININQFFEELTGKIIKEIPRELFDHVIGIYALKTKSISVTPTDIIMS